MEVGIGLLNEVESTLGIWNKVRQSKGMQDPRRHLSSQIPLFVFKYVYIIVRTIIRDNSILSLILGQCGFPVIAELICY